MQIHKIKLVNFRNYENEEIRLDPKINIIYGDNAVGKTNILESIFLCSFGKSFRTNREKELIKLGEDYFVVEIEYEKTDRDGKIKIELQDNKKISINGIKIKKLSELLGTINIVLFVPEDINIIKRSPSYRRRFLDMMIGQLRPSYVYNLNLYLKTLEQRNNYLKQIKYEHKDENLLEIWDEKLVEYAKKIYDYRFEFINKIKDKIEDKHTKITQNKEKINLEYISDCKDIEEFKENLIKSKKNDIIKGYTSKGIHRDDFEIYINDKLVNVYGSQGQNRTVVLSLKMSEMEVIYDEIGEYPILLLDDFMSELDKNRIKSFLDNVEETQIIITCTDNVIIENGKSILIKEGKKR